jgi:hypothetical protein
VSFSRYAVIVSGVVVASLALVWWLPSLDAPTRQAATMGGILAGGNSLAAYGLALWAGSRSTAVFMRAVLGGMVGRMAVMLGAVVAAVLVFDLPRVALAVSLLAYFVLFLAFELSVLHRSPDKTAVAR